MTSFPLEPEEATLRRWFGETLELLYANLNTLAEQPASHIEGARDAARAMHRPFSEDPGDAVAIIREVIEDYVPRSFHTAGPGYLAYIPGGGLVHAALADLISNITNRYIGVSLAAPLLVRLEVVTLRWLMDQMNYPAEARGIFTSGGSMANFSAVVCARHRQLGEQFQDGVLYGAEELHHSTGKAAMLAGFRHDQVRLLPVNDQGMLQPSIVAQAVAEDRSQGKRPAMLVGSAGTINVGAVDPLNELADLARSEGLWFHVDAAYGGPFQLTQRGQRLLQGIEKADSITMDPHKGFFLPYGTGCLLVRDGTALRDSHRVEADYLPEMQDSSDTQDFCDYSPELSRDFRGLRLWLALQLAGTRAFRDCLDEKLDLTTVVKEAIREIPALEIVGEAPLTLVAFRFKNDDDSGTRTQALLERLVASKRVMISGSYFQKRYVAKFCILSFRTHRDRVDEALDLLRREVHTMEGAA